MRSYNVKKLHNRDNKSEGFNKKLKMYQIVDTLFFELDKSRKKFFTMIIVSSIIILLNLSIYLLRDNTAPINPGVFVSFSSMLVLITSLAFGGSLIVRDFEQPIGNILFPKIPKPRLLIGRLIAALLLNLTVIGHFYFSSAVVTYGLNNHIPRELAFSFIYAGIYSILLLTFIIFLSSTMKSTSVVTILSLLAIILIFPILEVLLVVISPSFEPVFLLTYYARPITGIFTGTSDSNFFDIVNTETGESLLNITKSPSPLVVCLGVLVLSTLFLTLSYLQYERRQNH